MVSKRMAQEEECRVEAVWRDSTEDTHESELSKESWASWAPQSLSPLLRRGTSSFLHRGPRSRAHRDKVVTHMPITSGARAGSERYQLLPWKSTSLTEMMSSAFWWEVFEIWDSRGLLYVPYRFKEHQSHNEWDSSLLWLKNTHSLKIENYILFSGPSENLRPGGSLSDSSKGLLQRDKGEVLQQNQVVRTSEDYC